MGLREQLDWFGWEREIKETGYNGTETGYNGTDKLTRLVEAEGAGYSGIERIIVWFEW